MDKNTLIYYYNLYVNFVGDVAGANFILFVIVFLSLSFLTLPMNVKLKIKK